MTIATTPNPAKVVMGYKVSQPIKEIKVHSFLIKDVPVRHFAIEKRLPHREIAVCIAPVIARVEEGGTGCQQDEGEGTKEQVTPFQSIHISPQSSMFPQEVHILSSPIIL